MSEREGEEKGTTNSPPDISHIVLLSPRQPPARMVGWETSVYMYKLTQVSFEILLCLGYITLGRF